MSNELFQQLVSDGNPVGEVIAVRDFLVEVRGLSPVAPNALVMFANGARGMVRSVEGATVLVFSIAAEPVAIGTEVVVEEEVIQADVGDRLIGRAVSATGQPIDGGDQLLTDAKWPVFNEAPPLINRVELDQQLPTGVTVVDTLFPVVCGQRIAVMGDSRTGKTTFLLQMARNQAQTDRVVVYVLVSKRPDEINEVIANLQQSGAMSHAVIVATSIFDSPVESYLAPYVGCAIGEYFWNQGRDVIVMYDDLSNHAKIYREMSLLAGIAPGRDSYPGDIFYIHSSLLERAGKLSANGRSLTALPVVLTPNNDITSFLSTNVISITDGQLVFDVDVFHEGVKPAISTGLSVSRVGGKAQSDLHKNLAFRVSKKLADYHEAREFAHFTSNMAVETQHNLALGERLIDGLKQTPDQLFTLVEQQVMLAAALQADSSLTIDMEGLKKELRQQSFNLRSNQDFQQAVNTLIQQYTIRSNHG